MALTKVDISLVDNSTGFTIVTKVVTVAASKYVIDGVSQDTLTLTEGYTYKFDTSHATNATHHFKFSTTSDGTHGSGVDYTTGVTYNGTSGSAGAYTQIVVAASAPTLYYWCHHHASMGGTANTPAEAATTSMRYKIETKNQSYTAGIGAYQDHSSSLHTVTANNNPAVSTAQTKVGTHSIYFGSGNSHQNWLEVAGNHADFNFGAGNWTVEWWSKFTDTGSHRGFLYYTGNNQGANGWYINKSTSNKYVCNMYSTGSPNNLQVNGTVTVDDGAWHHNAFVRYGNVFTLYTDGNAAGTFSGSGYVMPSVHSHADAKMYIGTVRLNHGAAAEMSGYFDEIRISNVARYTANFTTFGQGGGTIASPTAFTSDSNTKLLIHGEVGAASGKITRIHGTSLAWS